MEQLEAIIGQAQQQLEKFDEENTSLKQEVETMKETITTLEGQVQNAQNSTATLPVQLEPKVVVEKQPEETKCNHDQELKQLSELKDQLEKLTKENEKLKTQK